VVAGAAHPHLGRTPEVFSVTLADCLPQLKWTIQSLASLASPPKVIIGGSVVNKHPEVATQSGADGTAPTFIEAIKEGNRLLGVTRRPLSLEDYLELLGSRVQECRRELGWNQQRLADTAGLDRTYISAVEHGKQNLTLGVVVKLSEALGVELGQLLLNDKQG